MRDTLVRVLGEERTAALDEDIIDYVASMLEDTDALPDQEVRPRDPCPARLAATTCPPMHCPDVCAGQEFHEVLEGMVEGLTEDESALIYTQSTSAQAGAPAEPEPELKRLDTQVLAV